MWLDSSEASIPVPTGFVLTYIERLIRGKPIERIVMRRGETKSARGIDIEHRSRYETYITLNEHGARLLESIGVAILQSDGRRLWLRTDTHRFAPEMPG